VTEAAVREIFFKHYSGGEPGKGDLNEALVASMEDIFNTIVVGHFGSLPDIVRTITAGRSRIGFFVPMFTEDFSHPVVPMSYILHFDHIRKAMLDTVNHMRERYNEAAPEFKKWFSPDDLKMMAADLSEAIEKPSGLPANTRGLNFNELNLEEEFFVKALIGILGVVIFKRCADDYNLALKTLRQCQAECKVLEALPDDTKES
jgi:hypothetical protein